MSLVLKSVVIHELIKTEKDELAPSLCKADLSDEILDVTHEKLIDIVKKLEANFLKKTLIRAKFSDQDGFNKAITNFKEIDVLSASKQLTNKLKDQIQNVHAAKGGYLVFVEYKTNNNFLSVFLVRNTDGSQLMRSGKSWDINSTFYLNVDHFAMGVRINLDILNDKDSSDRYISLVKGNTDISEYFEKWIGIGKSDLQSENKDADALYDLSMKMKLPDGISKVEELQKRIFDYAKSHPSKIINLHDLSQYLYGDRDFIASYCNENNIDIDGEFKLSGVHLRKFLTVFAKADKIEISAPKSLFGDKIRIEDGNLIIDSPDLIKQIQEQISKRE